MRVTVQQRVTQGVAGAALVADAAGADLVHWPTYLAPWIDRLIPGTAQQAMYVIGVIEIVAGIAVAIAPRFGAWLVAAWLAAIIVNLLTFSGFFDIALRDFGLLLAAVALARLATRYQPSWRTS